MTDTISNVSQFVWYAPYGEALVDEHTANFENPLKFSGKEFDEITGLYDHGARNRNPVSTLWYGIDPLFEKYPDFSPYNYCAGNPVRLVDLDGECFAVFFLPFAGEALKDALIYTVATVGGAVILEKIGETAKEIYDSYKEDSKQNSESNQNNASENSGKEQNGQVSPENNSDNNGDGNKTTYQTYTKRNEETGEVYTGRTSGKGTPRENIAKRDRNHHMNKKGYGPAKLDKSSTNYDAIRGREQQGIERNGGAKSKGGTSGNRINGISDKNPNKSKYMDACKQEFDE